ncbi:hypothetical protein H696_03333 [Fonticula alba]|uniref:DUF962 domain-containing protein n=1 Tax=Fonticula alba TaxID=691883 RepID=A0A058Z8K8_FONAL|nr:hypothetical protein H696_03333 [Fonticula alba]KCV69862.1 hypothetical protein H696_03333 [Fonticula alba]|eukprot:XP_009495468.1 hypothetical protein H696_03333 [Fonticula alba]
MSVEWYSAYHGEVTPGDRTNRRLHFAGTTAGLAALTAAVVLKNPLFILGGIITSYAFAWVGHFFFEKNKPATFKHPMWSLMGDFRMYWELLTGKIPL